MLTRRAAACLLAAAALLTMQLPMTSQTSTFELPKPTGPYSVGTTTWRVADAARREPFTGGTAREVEVLAWYPAAAAIGTSAPYLREGPAEARTWAKLLRAPDTTFDGLAAVVTHAAVDARPVQTSSTLPILLFSHGYTSLSSAYTALMEDLASHGYIALGIVHPYEVAVATLGDGRTVTMLDESGGLRQGIRDVLAEWGPEDATMAKVTAASAADEQRTVLRGYLANIPKTDLALRRWVDDTALVVGSIARAVKPSATGAGLLAGRFDLTRLGALGHSMGGVTAAQFCSEDRRCRAALNLDGIPQYGTLIDRTMDRPFLMVYSARKGRLGASDAIYARAASPYYRVDVRDTLHLDFCDLNFWGGPMRERGAFGAIDPARAAELTRLIVREFFDQELLHKPSALLSKRTNVPEITVQRVDR